MKHQFQLREWDRSRTFFFCIENNHPILKNDLGIFEPPSEHQIIINKVWDNCTEEERKSFIKAVQKDIECDNLSHAFPDRVRSQLKRFNHVKSRLDSSNKQP